jgi:hypothetical protein
VKLIAAFFPAFLDQRTKHGYEVNVMWIGFEEYHLLGYKAV